MLSVAFTAVTTFSYGQEETGPQNGGKDKAARRISADTLILDSKADCAEFIGNARAVDEDLVITADRLRVFFKDGSSIDRKLAAGEESVKKVVADGNVRITFDDRIAIAEKATIDEERLVLSGKHSAITMGEDSISGEKITYSRADGRIKVEGSPERRVEAVFHAGEEESE